MMAEICAFSSISRSRSCPAFSKSCAEVAHMHRQQPSHTASTLLVPCSLLCFNSRSSASPPHPPGNLQAELALGEGCRSMGRTS